MVSNHTIILQPIEDGWWLATIPEVPGAVSQGRNQKEAREMVLDALNEVVLARREKALKEARASAKVETLPLSA